MIRAETRPVRLLLLDDDEAARRRLHARLEHQPRVDVVGQTADGAEALRLTRDLRPDAILIETHRRDQQGIATIARFSRLAAAYRPAIIACLEIMHRSDWQDAQAVGADDVILKEMPADSLADEVLRIVAEHRRRTLSDGLARD